VRTVPARRSTSATLTATGSNSSPDRPRPLRAVSREFLATSALAEEVAAEGARDTRRVGARPGVA
jgi:hypothetical protein